MFLKEALEKLQTEAKNEELKEACKSALERLNAEIERRSRVPAAPGVLPHYKDFILADDFFQPFELACHSRTINVVNTALDSLHKLIAHEHLIGDGVDPAKPEDPRRRLIDRIVEAICHPFSAADETVELRILKVCCALALKKPCKVHDASMLLLVKTCFNICIKTSNAINQAVARTTLTQIITAVFPLMEQQVDSDDMIVKAVLNEILDQVAADLDRQSSSSPRLNGTSHRSTTSLDGSSDGHDSSDTVTDSRLHPNHNHINNNKESIKFQSIEEIDAFLIFRSLCVLGEQSAGSQNVAERSSVMLALDMILLIVQNVNVTFHERHSFVIVLRVYLCKALTKNAASQDTKVFEKALAIFVHLITKFKVHLRSHIEIFFREIIFSILESSASGFSHKWVAINAISKICDSSQNVVDIYVNYDCHLNSSNILQILVEHVRSIALGYTSLDKEQERQMRRLALTCMVKMLKSLVDWYEEFSSGRMHGDSASLSAERENGDENGLSSGSSANLLADVKQKKSILESGIDLFAKKPKHGLKFLQERGIVGTTAAEIADFLAREERRLDKTVIGDYLGDGDEFNKTVMYAYIDRFEFTGLNIVEALRKLLEAFRLPGEAQKIDRLMEKFASRYCECNPQLDVFASADTAYILSYSIIMLTTDLHSPQVRSRMTKEQYINMNKGINDQNDLPRELLCEIYDDIAANEIKMKPGAARRPKIDTVNATYRQRKLLQNLELEGIAQTAHALMEQAASAVSEYTSATHFDHVRPMFSLMWSPCLAAFSQGLQSSDDEDIWRECLLGFRYGIGVACVFQMTMQRDAFVQALTQFTLLNAKSTLRGMKAKNVASIKLLITIGDEDGNFLEDCWYDVLRCVSQLELAQHLGTQRRDHHHHHGENSVLHIDDKSLSALKECLSDASSQSIAMAVDRIFQGSSKLTGDAIVHFVRALCRVSHEELAIPGAPRMSMLQKIVEISFYNMNRIRIEWSMIWKVLGEHFNVAGCSANEAISSFALDALRQLATKFLEKGELPNFRLQKEFFRPFEVIMSRNAASREMIIVCMTNMVRSHGGRIRSGWKNIFSVFTMAATERREQIVKSAFETTEEIFERVIPDHFVAVLDSFQEAVKCLAEFACNHNQEISSSAIRLMRHAAALVSRNTDLINAHHSDDDSAAFESQKVWLKGWFPIIFELSCVINRSRLDERTMSLTALFFVIKTYGKEFRTDWWLDLFKIVFRIFDPSKLNELGDEKYEWMVTTCTLALCSIVDVFTYYYDELAPILLPSIYKQFLFCIEHGTEPLAKTAVNCFENLCATNGVRFDEGKWEETVQFISAVFNSATPDFKSTDPMVWAAVSSGSPARPTNPDSTIPNGIQPVARTPDTESDGTPPITPSSRSAHQLEHSVHSSSLTRCVIQLEMVDAVSSVLFGRNVFKVEGPVRSAAQRTTSFDDGLSANSVDDDTSSYVPMFEHISAALLDRIVEEMLRSHRIARQFNTNGEHKTVLQKATMKGTCKPNLLKQETHSIHCALNILFRLYGATPLDASAAIRRKLIDEVGAAIDYYLSLHSEHHRSAWLAVLQMLLNRTTDLDAAHFNALGMEYRRCVCQLITSEEQAIVRAALYRFVERSIIASD